MAKIAGRLANLTTDGTAVTGIVDATLNGENAMISTTTHDENSESYIYGRFGGTIDLTLLWDDDVSAAGQEAIKNDFFGKTTSTYVFEMEAGSGFDQFSCDGLVGSFAPSGPNDDAGEVSVTIQLTGDMTRSTQV